MALAILDLGITDGASALFRLAHHNWRILGEASSYTCYNVTIPRFEAEFVSLVPYKDTRFVLVHLFTRCY